MARPLIAIVGRPNVGKSTLFNRLVGRREAIVADEPGTTRDRLIAEVTWDSQPLLVVDTGGLEPRPQDPLRQRVQAQVQIAIQEADLIVFLLDAVDGLTPVDEEIAQRLRRLEKPLVVAVNKVDNPARQLQASEFYRLGLGDPVFLSAYHNTGIYDLMDRVVQLLSPREGEEEPVEEVLRLAIVGRPNVGKSLLLNAILGQERAIVSEEPGTTRDALDTPFVYRAQPMVLIDTAGIRRPGRVKGGVEHYSVLRAFRAVERSGITALVVDAAELITEQDTHIAGLAWEAGKGVVITVNKWDLAPPLNLNPEQAQESLRRHFHFMAYAPICFTSALKGTGIGEFMDTVVSLYRERLRRVEPEELYRAVRDAMASFLPPSRGTRSLHLYDVRQEGVNPPTFLFTVNDPNLVHFSYQRYLENRLREALDYPHTRLRLVFRSGKIR